MKKILLVNPPIFDFTAFDFWMKPFGLLKIGGYLRNKAEIRLFDFMDRGHQLYSGHSLKKDRWGRGKFFSTRVEKPAALENCPMKFRRFGLPPELFKQELTEFGPFDFVLIQTGMTYWYPGIQEVIQTVRKTQPGTKIVLGGVYATLCPEHAQKMGADLVVSGLDLNPLWNTLAITPDLKQPPFWEGYPVLTAGIIKLTEGCPHQCTYCSVSKVYEGFKVNSLKYSLDSLRVIYEKGAGNVAFYDDALLFRWEQGLGPFLAKVIESGRRMHFHTPNALNTGMINRDNAAMMVRAGFRHFYLGFESRDREWQNRTGAKAFSNDLARAVELLLGAGADSRAVTAYIIIGHPDTDHQDLEGSIKYAGSLGIRVMLSEFAPIPGTPDGEKCGHWIEMDEPLEQNKTYFTNMLLGRERVQELKNLCSHQNLMIGDNPSPGGDGTEGSLYE